MTKKKIERDRDNEEKARETHSQCGAASHSSHMIKAYTGALVIWGTAGHESSLDHTLRGFGERECPGDLQMNAIITEHTLYVSC